jgi:hypothetical protein
MVNNNWFMTRAEHGETAELVAARRARLREWIDKHHNGSQASFIRSTKPQINQGELSGLLKDKSFEQKRAFSLERQTPSMPPGYLAYPLNRVDATAQADNDMMAIQMIIESFAYALRENLPSAARDFADHLGARAKDGQFSELRGMIASVRDIALQGQSAAVVSTPPSVPRGSARKAS